MEMKCCSNLESSKALSYSAPGAINLEHSVVKFAENKEESRTDDEDVDDSQESLSFHGVDGQHDWQSLSCLTDSTEQSAPVNFDMSNRAKLPRGIEKIRPHIENIDNVPLLVSLFTDCTASSTKEMVRIMQDYGEVICVIGSSASYDNMGIFMQADASISVEPLYPQLCQKMQTMKSVDSGSISPIELAKALNSIACSLAILREDPLPIFALIMEARHFMQQFWNLVQFWLCCCLTLTTMQLCACLLMLPPLFTITQLLWISCIVVPCLSISLIGSRVDARIMKKPHGKTQIVFNLQVFTYVLWCYGLKFLPIILLVVFAYAISLSNYCMDFCALQQCSCMWFHVPTNANATYSFVEHEFVVGNTQNLATILVLFHFIAVSIGFVHREYNLWKRSPLSNFLWLATIILLLLLQTIFTLISVSGIANSRYEKYNFKISNAVLVFASVSPLITFVTAELVKREEIKVMLRYQKRARLDFGTKLGMNSPF